MNDRSRTASQLDTEGEKREVRARRILDAAASLILRYGYARTTIDEIAREARVSRGTLYLHWKTRETLLVALITREKIEMSQDIKRRIEGDPAGATLRSLLKHSALALMQRPLLKAVLLRDTQVFGKLIESEQSSSTSAEVFAGFTAYFQGLRAQGLMRNDLSLHELAVIFGSIFVGFFLATPLLPGTFKPSDEELAELMAETGHRTLEPRNPASPTALQDASHNLTQFLDSSVSKAQKQILGDALPEATDQLPLASPVGRVRGRKGGRPRKLPTASRVAEARRMHADRSRSIEEICSVLGISRATFYRYIKDSQPPGTE